MKRIFLLLAITCLSTALTPCLSAKPQVFGFSKQSVEMAFGNRKGCLAVVKCSSGESWYYNREKCFEKLPPCSTFKIWNTLIGLETREISPEDDPFYRWDGIERPIANWNKDLTLKEAFQASCVPAFQQLARKIGPERMKAWIDRIGYGDQNISAGIDVFWLPDGRKETILITPQEQVELIRNLLFGKLPFSKKSVEVLRDLMTVDKTNFGRLYGKTGSANVPNAEKGSLGWFVGFAESGENTYVFACVVRDTKGMGADAREVVRSVFEKEHLL